MDKTDLGDFLQSEIYPALFDRLDSAFPEYAFRRKGRHWVATADATRSLPGSPRPDRVNCYIQRPWRLTISGGDSVRFLELVNGGTKPLGTDFVEAVRKLAKLAGVPFPELQVSPEEVERHARQHARRSALETVGALCHDALLSDTGDTARDYLEKRGLDGIQIIELGIGLYTDTAAVEEKLRKTGHDVDAARAEGLLFARMTGYAVFPWADASGQPMTLYGRWPGKTPPEGKPKTLALPGEGTKASPLYFDRARQAGHKDLVLVEGLIDAALLQARGEGDVIACMGAEFSSSQLDTLARYGVRSVTICLDPDGAGETGTLACIKGLSGKGINAFVAPVLPNGMGPAEYVLAHGLETWRAHIGRAEHGFRYKARAIVKSHKGEGWTNRSLVACMDEAFAFDADEKDPARLTDLASFFWPAIQEATGTDFDAINARRDAAREKAEKERERRAYDRLVHDAGDRLREGNLDAAKALLREETDHLRTQERHWHAEPIRNVADELGDHEARLAQWRGREFIGLPQKTLPKLDALTLGLRGFMLLAAAPNVGKTALAIQLGLDAVVHNPSAAFLFLSLEMSRWDILTRLRSRLASLDWHALVFGSGRGGGAPSFTPEEYRRIEEANDRLAEIGRRLRILDDKNFPVPTLAKVLDQVEDLKASSGSSRIFILVDYLQVWPVPDVVAKTLRTDVDADKWRIGQMKELRDAIGSENATLVISEAQMPSNDAREWAGDMGAVVGAARRSYTPDMVLLLNPLSDEDLGKLEGVENGEDARKAGKVRREVAAAHDGFATQRLSIVKGRDGVQRDHLNLHFHFRQSRFEEI